MRRRRSASWLALAALMIGCGRDPSAGNVAQPGGDGPVEPSLRSATPEPSRRSATPEPSRRSTTPEPSRRSAPAVGAARPSIFPTAPRPPGARPPRIASVRDYRRSGDHPYWQPGEKPRWSPAEIVRILSEDRDYLVDMGIWTGRPTGHPQQRELGRVVNETQALARARGIDTSRLAFSVRTDVYVKHDPAHGRCGDHCGWEGERVDDPFDPRWIFTVPRSEQRWAIEHRWGGDWSKDPWAPGSHDSWPGWIDREAMAAANTPTHVGALYGYDYAGGSSRFGADRYFGVSGIVMDLRNADYRAWSVRRILADLRVIGIDPGESAVLIFGYKPGWHAYYSGSQTVRQDCFVPGSHMWIGPAGACSRRLRHVDGPFVRTPYGPGEFEAAVSQMLRDLRAGLVAAGNPGVRIATVERPRFVGVWQVLEPDLRSAPWIIGELGPACHRLDVARSGPCPLP